MKMMKLIKESNCKYQNLFRLCKCYIFQFFLSREDFVYDFDIMMQRKKEENYRRRKRKNIDLINDNDDIIAELMVQMKQAAEV